MSLCLMRVPSSARFRISTKSLRTFRNVLETFRNRALKLVRSGMKDKEPKMTPSLAVQGDWRMPVTGRR